MARSQERHVARWTGTQLAIAWVSGAILELGMFRLRRAGAPGWAWGTDPQLPASDPLSGYSLVWRYHEQLRLLGGIGVWVVPLVLLVLTWLRYGNRGGQAAE